MLRQRVQQAGRARGVDDDRPRRPPDEAGGDRVVEEAEELVVEARAVEDADGLGVESELLPGDLRGGRGGGGGGGNEAGVFFFFFLTWVSLPV